MLHEAIEQESSPQLRKFLLGRVHFDDSSLHEDVSGTETGRRQSSNGFQFHLDATQLLVGFAVSWSKMSGTNLKAQ